MEPRDRLIVALDVPTLPEARDLASALEGVVTRVKVGLELYCGHGPEVVTTFVKRGFKVMLDLKLHDIPATVARATSRVAELGADFLTVHTAGGPQMLAAAADAAVKAGGHMQLLGVTVLTSLTKADLEEIGVTGSLAGAVTARARLAVSAGLSGVVASPLELKALREALPAGSLIVTPGIRPAGSDPGDQQRVSTPAKALADGADFIVVGRPIRDARDPAAAAAAIVAELA